MLSALLKKTCIVFLTVTFFGISSFAYATTLSLTSIGNVDTSGKNSVQTWYYTGSQPSLAGTAPANIDVNITVGSVSSTTTADAKGNWSWQTTQDFAQGENQVTLTSGSETLSFKLVIGQTWTGEESTSQKG